MIVYFQGTVAIRDTLQEALTAVFGESPNTREEGFGGTDATGGAVTECPRAPTGTALQQAAKLLQEADAFFTQADEALAAKDLAKYQELTKGPGQDPRGRAGPRQPTPSTSAPSTTSTTAPNA